MHLIFEGLFVDRVHLSVRACLWAKYIWQWRLVCGPDLLVLDEGLPVAKYSRHWRFVFGKILLILKTCLSKMCVSWRLACWQNTLVVSESFPVGKLQLSVKAWMWAKCGCLFRLACEYNFQWRLACPYNTVVNEDLPLGMIRLSVKACLWAKYNCQRRQAASWQTGACTLWFWTHTHLA